MIIGEHKGKKVKDAKPIIKDEMTKNGTKSKLTNIANSY